jgi:hypothetical protein
LNVELRVKRRVNVVVQLSVVSPGFSLKNCPVEMLKSMMVLKRAPVDLIVYCALFGVALL